jgi:quinohemoprotein ethanol dehydrogenase
MEEAAKTRHGQWWGTGAGGAPWDSIVYDHELDLAYAGTGNGTAWYRNLRSPGGGDNLYLASIIALRATDGELVWHYQVAPGDNWGAKNYRRFRLTSCLVPLPLQTRQNNSRSKSVPT